jgi:hypothetical protein
MRSSFVSAALRSTSRNLILANVLLLGATLFMSLVFSREIRSAVKGSFEMSRAALLATRDADSLQSYYVSVSGDDIIPLGREVEEGTEKVRARYVALDLDGRLLLVRAKPEAGGVRYTGRLANMNPILRASMMKELGQEQRELMRALLPVMLYADESPNEDRLWLLLPIAAFGLAFVNIKRGMSRYRDPSKHPSMRALALYGAPRANANAIDAEVAASKGGIKVGKVVLTANWLLQRRAFALDAVPMAEVVWIYKHVTTHYYYFIPVGKSYAIIVHRKRGKDIHIEAKKKTVDDVLKSVMERAPWAIAGFNTDVRDALNGPQRAEILQQMDEARRQSKAAAAA